jgi:hypothetical protein
MLQPSIATDCRRSICVDAHRRHSRAPCAVAVARRWRRRSSTNGLGGLLSQSRCAAGRAARGAAGDRRRPAALRPCGFPEELRASSSDEGPAGRARGIPDPRGDHLFGLHLAQRAAPVAPRRGHCGGDQLCHAACPCALGRAAIRLSGILAAIAAIGYRAYPYDAAKSEELARQERRSALWRVFVAGFGMMQVMMYAVPVYLAGAGEMTPAGRAVDALGEPGADAAGGLLFGRALLRQCLARPATAACGDGCAGRAGNRRSLCGERLGDPDGQWRGLFRFGDDVRFLFCSAGAFSR